MATLVSDPVDASQRGRHLGAALVVIATAQLMVVLDATIVTVALPRIGTALGFSGTGLEWVVNAYLLAFGGLLLLGGRVGDVLGRRRMFVIGLLVFSLASLVGGFATSPAWLLTARAVQGAGGAIVAPTALALVATTFPEGRARSRAMGVYSGMSAVGTVLGLIAGGLLVTYGSWRWVLFVNVPIGVAAAFAAPYVLPGSGRRSGAGFDLPGAITATVGMTALVYGLTDAAPGSNGVSHWGSSSVLASLVGGAVLLAAFVVIEARSRQALLPLRLLRSRDRAGATLIMLVMGTAIFGMFVFLSLFVQDVWGYSALRTAMAFLPVTIVMLVGSVGTAALVPRLGARPLVLAGGALTAGGMFWLSRVTEHSSYAGGLLGPGLVMGTGFGMLMVPLTLISLARVPAADSGAAASLLNTARQVGGAIGLAILGTVAWTVVTDTARASHGGAAAYRHALTVGFDRAFLVAAVAALGILVLTVAMIRIRRSDLAGD